MTIAQRNSSADASAVRENHRPKVQSQFESKIMNRTEIPGAQPGQNGHERGIALLTVITCLVALMVIAVPFAISMRMGQERSEVHNARQRARNTVDSILNFQKAFLVQTTENVEIKNRADAVKGMYSDPDMDNLVEIQPTLAHMASALGVAAGELEDPYGLIAGAHVEDENGKVNLNSNSLFMLGNLMGLGLLNSDLEPSDTSISLNDTSAFPERGYVKVGRELIKYTGKEPGRLTGCTRGVLGGRPEHEAAKQHKAGFWCVNYAAWAISYYTVSRHPGEYTPWTALDVSDISSLEPDLDPDVPVLTQADWERVRPFVTVWSKGESGSTWANIQDLTEGQRLPEKQTTRGDRFKFGVGYYYSTGSIVRLSESVSSKRLSGDLADDGALESGPKHRGFDARTATVQPRRFDYGMSYHVNPQGPREYQMELFGKAHRRFRGNQARLEYRVPTPINVNTASRDVLIAMFANLRSRRRAASEGITPGVAATIADEIIRRREGGTPLASMRDFRAMLTDFMTKKRVLSVWQRSAIFRNAVNPHDQGLFFGTAPIAFRTFDVYTLRAAASVNDKRGGRLLAKHSETRVVEIGSQVTSVRVWETQKDFEKAMWETQDSKFWTTSPKLVGAMVRNQPQVQPWPRWRQMVAGKYFPWDPYYTNSSDEEAYPVTSSRDSQITTNGDLRLQPAQMYLDLAPVEEERVFVEHFNDSGVTEGFYAEAGFPLRALFDRAGIAEPRANSGDQMTPFSVQFWWRPESNPNDAGIIFDWGQDTFQNRISCYVQDGTLIFSVSDNTDTNRAAELRYELSEIGTLQSGVFYHFQLIAAGCNTAKMAMILDGRSVGTPNISSPLAGNVAIDDTVVSVEDSSGFPPVGAVIIGTEVIEYEENSNGALKVRTDADGNVVGRGARRTIRQDHPQGAPAALFGYSRPITAELKTGGATLTNDMAPWAVVEVQLNEDTDFNGYDPSVTPIEYSIPGGSDGQGGDNPDTQVSLTTLALSSGDTWSNMIIQPAPGDGVTTEERIQAFQERGYAMVVYYGGTEEGFQEFANGTSGDQTGAIVEFVRYERSGTSETDLRLIRLASDNDGASSAPEREEDWNILLAARKTVSGGTPSVLANTVPNLVYVFPVSIRATEATAAGYINPEDESDIQQWVAQLYQINSDDIAVWEWFRYNEIISSEGSSYFLQCTVPNPQLIIDALLFQETAIEDWLAEPLDGEVTDPDDPDDVPPDDGDTGGTPPPPDTGGGGGGGPPEAPPSDGPGSSPGGEDPGDPPPDSPDDDGPGGSPGTDPDDPSETPPDPDGPGGNPDPSPDDPGNDPAPDDGSGGSPDPTPDDPGGGAPPPDGGGGSPVPPTDGGGDAPPSGGPSPEPGDPEPPAPEPNLPPGSGEPPADDDPAGTGGLTTRVANTIRFRGVQDAALSAGARNGAVDDWWAVVEDFEGSKHRDGSLIIPMAGCYGGPQDQVGTDSDGDGNVDSFGTDFSIWPLPGTFDQVTLVTGDDEQIEGGELDVNWAMKSTSRRFWNDTDGDGIGDEEPWEFEEFQHLFVLTRQVGAPFAPSEDLEVRKADQRENTRLLCFPTGELPDQPDNMSGPFIGRSLEGDATPCTIDEIHGDTGRVLFDLTLKEAVGATDTTLKFTSEEGTPADEDLEDGPGVIRIGEEMIVWDEVEIEGDAMVFTGCVRGTQLSQPSAYPVGTLGQPMVGIYVALLTNATNAQSNILQLRGAGGFAPTGVVRLEDPESESAELRLYTLNKDGLELQMPIAEGVGSGVFLGRYGSISQAFATGMPVFWHPVRTWDRFSEFVDNPEIAFFGISQRFTDAYVKRIWWKQGQMPAYTNVRVVVRLDEAVGWNARVEDVLFLSRDGARSADSVPEKFVQRMKQAGNAARFLRAMEQPNADNLLGIDQGVQADIVEARIYCIYHKGAFTWTRPEINAWKQSPILQGFGIEYVQQNATRAHIDR